MLLGQIWIIIIKSLLPRIINPCFYCANTFEKGSGLDDDVIIIKQINRE
jgi:hypothetical protein